MKLILVGPENPIGPLQAHIHWAIEHRSATRLAGLPAPCVIPNDRCARWGWLRIVGGTQSF